MELLWRQSALRPAGHPGPGRTDPQPHVARRARGDRRRRPAAARLGGQRAASPYVAPALATPAAADQRRARRAVAESAARARPAVLRLRKLRMGLRRDPLERALHRSLA